MATGVNGRHGLGVRNLVVMERKLEQGNAIILHHKMEDQVALEMLPKCETVMTAVVVAVEV